jgi:hypothetical protein
MSASTAGIKKTGSSQRCRPTSSSGSRRTSSEPAPIEHRYFDQFLNRLTAR